ncbi:MAG: DsbC family protein [Gammaproteobacteria bacterium]
MRTLLLVFAVLFAAAGRANAADDLKSRLTTALRDLVPDAEVTSVVATPVAGLYEVALGARLYYMSEDGHFLLNGDLVDLKAKKNVSEERREQARAAALQHVQGAIEFAPPNPRHVVYVFTDIDCGYCRKLHQQIAQINAEGIAVRYLAYPRAGIGSESYGKAVSVWCAADRRQALTDAKSGKDLAAAKCSNPVAAQYKLGEALGIQGTPAVFSVDGRELGGYLPPQRLAQKLDDKKS